nr:immunoglobulin light chain junction region [Macaca mulatta]MOX17106.1 immunoglobulin light chain junction region [Macaca mulatta]MOX17111.1 immunoglobulin light chain junction region [Macaca mulatta]MOX17237.1 immunoglobulin light chain junction region [Macaca mulatta]MOX17441.1 immunoglobulin light chain junction region [Macaca mulatta]
DYYCHSYDNSLNPVF